MNNWIVVLQQAIRALNDNKISTGNRKIDEFYNSIIEQDISTLRTLHNMSILQDGWTDVTDDTPKHFGEYWVTIRRNNGDVAVKAYNYNPYENEWNYGDLSDGKVIAWMPKYIPEPWKRNPDDRNGTMNVNGIC